MVEGSRAYASLPSFLSYAEGILEILRTLSEHDLQKMYKCSPAIAHMNHERIHSMDMQKGLMPAVMRYSGMQYKHLDVSSMDASDYEWLQEHVRIPDAFYGILRAFDGIVPYRLDFHCKPGIDLYRYWQDMPAKKLQDDVVIDLAGKEHASLVLPYIDPSMVYTCVFEKNGKTHSTLAKSARGEMLRWMTKNRIERPEDIKQFHEMGLQYDPIRSDIHTFVFVAD